jgi:hypothetical protein
MIARFDHRPILMTMALATVVCVFLVALTLFVAAQAFPSSGPTSTPMHICQLLTCIGQ